MNYLQRHAVKVYAQPYEKELKELHAEKRNLEWQLKKVISNITWREESIRDLKEKL